MIILGTGYSTDLLLIFSFLLLLLLIFYLTSYKFLRKILFLFDPELIHKISLPAKNVTNCTFGGHNNSEIFITTATKGMNKADLLKYRYSGFLFSIKTNTKGFLQKKFTFINEKKRSLLRTNSN